jgi:chromosome segregation ATPase
MPDLDVTIKLSQLQDYEKELTQLKSRNRFLEISYHAEQTGIVKRNQEIKVTESLVEAKQDIINALKDSKAKIQNDLINANDNIVHLRHGTQQLQEKIEKLEAFIGSCGLITGTSYDIYKLIDDNQKLNQELQETKDRIEYLVLSQNSNTKAYQGYLADLKSALAVEVSNVCDLDNEKQELIEILAEKNDVTNCLKADLINSQNSKEAFNYIEGVRASYEQKLKEQHQTLTQEFDLLNRVIVEKDIDIASLKAEKVQLENQLAATIASNTSFTLSGDYQVTKISKGKSLFNQAEEENHQNYDTWQGQETSTWDDDIYDEPDPSIGW